MQSMPKQSLFKIQYFKFEISLYNLLHYKHLHSGFTYLKTGDSGKHNKAYSTDVET